MKQELKAKLIAATQKANISLRKDVRALLESSYQKEENPRARKALGWIRENAYLAKRNKLPLCQDTGLPIIIVEIGRNMRLDINMVEEAKKVVEDTYRQSFFRPSLVDALKRGKPSYRPAQVHIEINHKLTALRFSVFPKGFGSENKTKLKMFNPTASLEEIENFVLEAVKKAGPEACPPFVVGIGIGGTSERALFLAKYALLSDLQRTRGKNRAWEEKILKKINALGIGPMGLGGKTTALAVKIMTAPTHIAGLPVGVNISCWALRSSSFMVKV